MTIKNQIVKFEEGYLIEEEDEIVIEFPLTIILNQEEFATLVCTPCELDELVIGFLASEGVIRTRDEIIHIHIDSSKGFAYIDTNTPYTIHQEFHSKRMIGSCCGKSRQFYFVNDAKTAKTSTSTISISPEECIFLMKELQNNSHVFKNTGGVHNAALCSPTGIIINRADIGRHNALDKIYGYCLINKVNIRDKIIVFSGRISSEVLLKAAKIGVGIVLSKSAPSDLAIKMAEDLNITTVGFIRGNKLNIYSHPNRILGNFIEI